MPGFFNTRLLVAALAALAPLVAGQEDDPSEQPEFAGWYIHPGGATTEAINCWGFGLAATDLAWTTTDSYATCCPERGGRACHAMTECDGQTGRDVRGSTVDCAALGSDVQCQTMTVFEDEAENSAHTQYFCAQAWLANSVYRTLDVTTTTSSSSSSSATSSSQFPSSTSQSSIFTSGTPSPSRSQSTAPSSTSGADNANQSGGPDPAEKSSSKAWIAGAVIGPVVAVIVIAAIAFWLGKRSARSKMDAAAAAPLQPDQYHQQGPGSVAAAAAPASSYGGSPQQQQYAAEPVAYKPYDAAQQQWNNPSPQNTSAWGPPPPQQHHAELYGQQPKEMPAP